MGGGDGADDSQPEPVSASVLDALAAESLEWLEEAVHLTRRDLPSGVSDRQDRAPLGYRRTHIDLAAWQVVPQSVVHQVGYQALRQARVAGCGRGA